MLVPILAGLAGLSLVGNPPRRRRKARRRNPQDYWWYPKTRAERHHKWRSTGRGALLSPTKPHADKPGIRWRRDKRTEKTIGLPDTNRQNPVRRNPNPSEARLKAMFDESDPFSPFDSTARKALTEMLHAVSRASAKGSDPVAAARRSWIGPQGNMSQKAWDSHYHQAQRMLAAGRPKRRR